MKIRHKRFSIPQEKARGKEKLFEKINTIVIILFTKNKFIQNILNKL